MNLARLRKLLVEHGQGDLFGIAWDPSFRRAPRLPKYPSPPLAMQLDLFGPDGVEAMRRRSLRRLQLLRNGSGRLTREEEQDVASYAVRSANLAQAIICLFVPGVTRTKLQPAMRKIEAETPQERRKLMRARTYLSDAVAMWWRLVLSMDRYAEFEASRLARYGHDAGDMLQVVREGLFEAAMRFDPTRGLRFSTLGKWWVRSVVNRHCYGETTPLGMPASAGQARIAIKHRIEYRTKRGDDWTRASIASEMGMSEARLDDLLFVDDVAVPIHLPLDPNSGRPLSECITDENATPVDVACDRSIDMAHLEFELRMLPADEADVVRRYYGIQCPAQSMSKIARALSISEAKATKRFAAGVLSLRDSLDGGAS